MGMSASQARLLALTARQSNLEYEGQQINQQRTNLSNQSANYYNSLLTMTVPTPPSTDDYTTIKYSFVIGGNDAVINRVLPQSNGQYLVDYTTTLSAIGIQDNRAYKVTATTGASDEKLTSNSTSPTTYDDSKRYYTKTFVKSTDASVTTTLLKSDGTDISTRINDDTMYFDKNGYEVNKTDAMTGNVLKEGYTALVDKTDNEEAYVVTNIQLGDKAAFDEAKTAGVKITEYTVDPDNGRTIDTIKASNGVQFTSVAAEYKEAFINSGLDANEYYQYKSSTGIRFATKSDVQKAANNSNITVMTSAAASITKPQNNTLQNANVEFDASGRISSITDSDGKTYTMTASTETDDAAYEDACNQYIYNQYVYDQKQNEINANIEILQAQDKNLELRLSQLNTEHSAIQTEMEAVQKVLSKNIDNSFKTFNA